ncbi:beta-galactosidase/beta-glucuronidase [[Actinobacillus] rossii]|uniref:Beta-glucuronidase n=1 Tax=[Actinobacillus] rossii TaxID=123820 RepID=A0A380TW37_9PAST|nr:beta-galactosidase/beta-glucuronidase [[Actinobacillus] rossii]
MLYPIATQTRQLVDLSGVWQFKLADQQWQPMAVPGSFNDQLILSEYKNYVGDFFYQTEFFVTEAMLNQRVFVRFGSVTHYAAVFVNEQYIGEHQGGFTPFEFEVTEFVTLGRNVLRVNANNILNNSTLPVGNYSETVDENGNVRKKLDENFDFFNYAGIHRPVMLWCKPKNYIEDITITYELQDNQATVNFAIEVVGEAKQIKVTVLDEQSQVVATSIGGAKQQVEIDNVIRWQPLNAYLYQAVVELVDGDVVEDSYSEPFGMRTVEVKNNQFLINGEPFYFKGYGRHEDTYLNGRGLSNVANVLDVNLMKWQGANSFRTSHYPYSEEMMRLADREGFVVIDETTAVGLMYNFGVDMKVDPANNTWKIYKTGEAHRQVIRELIQRDKNYACVVMWSIANEASTAEEGAYEYFEPLFKLARELDPQNRPCCFVNLLLATPETDVVAPLTDVICLNRYCGWYRQLSDLDAAKKALKEEVEHWHRLYPDKPIMFTEYGADTVAGLHDMDFNTPFTEEYQVEYYKANNEVIDQLPYFVGEQVWNFADFQTKYGIFRVQGNKKGLFTRARMPKMAAHYFKQRWDNIPNFNYKK